jgi:hypothetical protein
MGYGARVAAMAMQRAALVDVLAVRAACQQPLGHLGQSLEIESSMPKQYHWLMTGLARLGRDPMQGHVRCWWKPT